MTGSPANRSGPMIPGQPPRLRLGWATFAVAAALLITSQAERYLPDRSAEITDAVLVGNTVMHHLVAGLPVSSLGRAPYTPAVVLTAPTIEP